MLTSDAKNIFQNQNKHSNITKKTIIVIKTQQIFFFINYFGRIPNISINLEQSPKLNKEFKQSRQTYEKLSNGFQISKRNHRNGNTVQNTE